MSTVFQSTERYLKSVESFLKSGSSQSTSSRKALRISLEIRRIAKRMSRVNSLDRYSSTSIVSSPQIDIVQLNVDKILQPASPPSPSLRGSSSFHAAAFLSLEMLSQVLFIWLILISISKAQVCPESCPTLLLDCHNIRTDKRNNFLRTRWQRISRLSWDSLCEGSAFSGWTL